MGPDLQYIKIISDFPVCINISYLPLIFTEKLKLWSTSFSHTPIMNFHPRLKKIRDPCQKVKESFDIITLQTETPKMDIFSKMSSHRNKCKSSK